MTSEADKYDIVVVGSGLGGLLCGSILSKQGLRVCVLEKHHTIGGNLQTFRRKGCVFDTGMHYIGCLEKGQIQYQVFKYLNILHKLKTEKLDEDGYELICIDKREYKYAMGFEKFSKTLQSYFPDDTEAIKKFVSKIKDIWDNSDFLNLRHIDTSKVPDLSPFAINAHDFICSLTDNEELRAVLGGTNGLLGSDALNTPLYLLANINNFYIHSAWRLVGGGQQLADALKENIQKAGGVVKTKSAVSKFHFKEGEKNILAAETVDGSIYRGNKFISNIHPSLTFEMIEPGKLRKAYVNRINSLQNSVSAFTINIVLKKNSFPHLRHNVYYTKNNQVWFNDAKERKPWPHGFMFYTNRQAGTDFAESANLITFMDFEDVAQWEHTTLGKREPAYKEFKEKKAKELLELAEKKYPGFQEKVETYYVSSPLTYRDYTGTPKGSIYGIANDCNDPIKSNVSAGTRIPNLFFTGQNMNIHGMLGVTMGAIITCGHILDINSLIDGIKES